MSRTPRATPTKTKQKECADVEQEFCTRALSLLASFYETPSTSEILTFPPAKKVDVPPPDRKIAFHSNVADLRLKRSQDQLAKENVSINQNIATRIEEMAETLKTSTVDLDDIFLPEQAERPELPRYLVNQQLDEKRERELVKKPTYKPMDMTQVQHEYTRRLEAARKKGVERAKHRAERQQAGEAKSPFRSSYADDNDPRVREAERMKIVKARRAAQVGYKTPDEYRQYVKPKSVSKTSD